MLTEDFSLEFSGFQPTADMREWLDCVLSETFLHSPSQSFLKVTFTLTEGLFVGAIDITSTAGNFMAKAADGDVAAMGAKLFKSIRRELKDWSLGRVL